MTRRWMLIIGLLLAALVAKYACRDQKFVCCRTGLEKNVRTIFGIEVAQTICTNDVSNWVFQLIGNTDLRAWHRACSRDIYGVTRFGIKPVVWELYERYHSLSLTATNREILVKYLLSTNDDEASAIFTRLSDMGRHGANPPDLYP